MAQAPEEFRFAKATASTTERVPPGEYIWKFTDFEVTPGTFPRKAKDGSDLPPLERIKFIFGVTQVDAVDTYPSHISEDDGDACDVYDASLIGSDVWVFANNSMDSRADLRHLLEGMIGRAIENDEEPPAPSTLMNRDYKVTYGYKSYTVVGTNEVKQKLWPLVIKPFRARRTAAAQVANAPMADDEPPF